MNTDKPYIDDLMGFTAELLKSIPIIDSGLIVMDDDVDAQSQKDIEVTFNKEFPEVPNIIAGLSSSSTGSRNANLEAVVLYGSQSKTGFTIRLYNNDTAARKPGIVWQAVYQAGGGNRIKRIFSYLRKVVRV